VTDNVLPSTDPNVATDEIGGVHYQKIKLYDGTADSTTAIPGSANGLFTQGQVAHDAVAAGNPLLIGGYAKAAAPTNVSADGDSVNAWFLRNGAQAVSLTSGGAILPGDATHGLEVQSSNRDFFLATVQGMETHDASVSRNPFRIAGYAKDTAPTAVSTDGDVVSAWYSKIGAAKVDIVTPNGDSAMDDTNDAVKVNVVTGSAAGTEYTEDVASAGAEKLTMAGAVRQDTLAASTSTDGDYAYLKTDALGRLRADEGMVMASASITAATVYCLTDGMGFNEVHLSFANYSSLVASVFPQYSNDGTNWSTLRMKGHDREGVGLLLSVETEYHAVLPGRYFRINVPSYTSGSVDVTVMIRRGSGAANVLPIYLSGDSTTGQTTSGFMLMGLNASGTTETLRSTSNALNVSADTELNAAAALSDTIANPTTAMVGSANMIWDGSQWVRRKQVVNAIDTTGAGFPGAAIMAQFDDASTGTVTENQFSTVRMSSRRALLIEGVASGTAITVDSELPTAAALSDSIANPSSPMVGAAGMLWNGATWVRSIGDTTAGQWIQGQVAHDSAAIGNPVLVGARASTTTPSAVTAGDAVRLWASVVGALKVDIVTPNGDSAMDDTNDAVKVRGAADLADNAAFTDGSSLVVPAGFIYDDLAGTALSENDVAASRIDSKRAQVMVIEDATTRGQRVAVSSAGGMSVVAAGDTAHDAVDAGNPIKIGGKANTAAPTAVAAGDRVDAWMGTTGAQAMFLVASASGGVLANASPTDDFASANSLTAKSYGLVYDGTNWDMARSTDAFAGNGALTVVGATAVGVGPGFDRRFNPSNLGTATNSASTQDVNGAAEAMVQIGTSTTGTFTFEFTVDGTTWVGGEVKDAINDVQVSGANITPTAGRTYRCLTSGYRQMRLRTTATLGATVAHAFDLTAASTIVSAVDMGPAPHVFGYAPFHFDKEYTTTQTGAAMWTPASGKKFVVTDLRVNVGGTTGGILTIWQGASADTTYNAGTDRAVYRGEFAPSSTVKPGFILPLRTPFVSDTADHILRITTSAGMTCYIQGEGYEI
jgi:hypothetical protein